MNPQTIDLSGLRDIHAIAEPPFFPPAIGWWIMVGIFLCFFLIGWSWYRFYYMSTKQYARRTLRSIMRADLPTTVLGVEISKLLKRVALVRFPREQVAGLSGTDWAIFLYEHGGRKLTKEQADFIAQAAFMPAQKNVAIDEKKLYTAVNQWMNQVFKKGKNGN